MEKSARKKILFIAWDNPKSNYLEGLFVPIFQNLQKQYDYEFHIAQFSWASEERKLFLKNFCAERGMTYHHIYIQMWPVAFVGKYFTLFKGVKWLSSYTKENAIDIILPRSTMPASMAIQLKKRFASTKIVFDADGLPIEERVDFAGLRKGSLRYRKLKRIEGAIIRMADTVLARTEFAVRFLKQNHDIQEEKFFRVVNGRDELFFQRKDSTRNRVRENLKIPADATVITYCGSLGPQYGVEQMIYLHSELRKKGNFYLLIVTNNPGYPGLPKEDPTVRIVSSSITEIPAYLSAGDIGMAIREAKFSMRGVAPIKLGEYLLMGMPIIASAGIGDSDTLFKNREFCFLLQDYRKENLDKAVEWVLSLPSDPGIFRQARAFGEQHFSLTESISSYHAALQNVSP